MNIEDRLKLAELERGYIGRGFGVGRRHWQERKTVVAMSSVA